MSESQRRWRRRHPGKAYASARRWQAENPDKRRAHILVRDAERRGDLIRPDTCEECGARPGLSASGRSLIVAHHDDYSQPLNLRWLCRLCHAAGHIGLSKDTF